MEVLHWNYKKTDSDVLNCIAYKDVHSQIDIANELEMSRTTIERKISKLKKDGLLKIWRLKDSEIYYCIGSDVDCVSNAYEAKEVFRHRQDMYEDRSVVKEPSKCYREQGALFDKPSDICNQDELDDAVSKLGY